MSVRRSVRLNPTCTSNLNSKEVEGNSADFVQDNKNMFKEEQMEKSPEDKCFINYKIQKISEEEVPKNTELIQLKKEPDVELDDEKHKLTSATVKALKKMGSSQADKKKGKKGKIPVAHKRKMLNKRLSKLLTPKSALILLHELKPNCVYQVEEQPGCIPPSFFAQVFHNNEIIGTGQGLSKSHAKNSAAENAIKAIVSRTMSYQSVNIKRENNSVELDGVEMEDTPENLPWAGLASFAIYKMFSEWQAQGADLLTRSTVKPKVKASATPNAPTKKDLPPNAIELHPAVVLNMVCPGLTAVEVEREDGPKCRVKMAYSVNGKMFSGVGGNKKDAKKEAAKAVLEGLYGLTYPQ